MLGKDLLLYKKFVRCQNGFTLLESFLALGILSLILISGLQITENWAKTQRATVAAKHLILVHNAAESYIRDNFANIFSALATGPIEISIEGTTGSPTFFLKDSGTYLPANFNGNNIFGQRLTVLVRDATNGGSEEKIEAVVVSDGRAVDTERMIDTAKTAGNIAGLITGSTIGAYNSTQFVGAYGGWSTDLSDYSALTWDDNNLPLDPDEAHLASFIEMIAEDALDDYLYRIELSGQEEANQMFVDLNMNNNNINNVVTLEADYVDANSMQVGNSVTATEGFVARGGVNVTGGVFVEDTINLGSLLVAGDTSAVIVDVVDTITGDANNSEFISALSYVGGQVQTQSFSGIDITLTDLLTREFLVLNADINVRDVVNIDTATVGGFGAGELQATSLNINGNLLVSDRSEIDGNALISNGVRKGSGSLDILVNNLNSCQTTTNGFCN